LGQDTGFGVMYWLLFSLDTGWCVVSRRVRERMALSATMSNIETSFAEDMPELSGVSGSCSIS
jgi:hypothetical protein